jgi:hypothetical protein
MSSLQHGRYHREVRRCHGRANMHAEGAGVRAGIAAERWTRDSSDDAHARACDVRLQHTEVWLVAGPPEEYSGRSAEGTGLYSPIGLVDTCCWDGHVILRHGGATPKRGVSDDRAHAACSTDQLHVRAGGL